MRRPSGERVIRYEGLSLFVTRNGAYIGKESWTSVFGKNCLNYGTPARIAREYDGVLYIGTNDGLLGYDLKTRKIHVYGIETGLADNGIASVEQDSMGRLWISRAQTPIVVAA